MAWMYQALTYSLSGFGPTSVVLCRAGRWLLEKRKPTYQPTRLISNMMSTDITWELSKHPLLISPQILLSLFVDVRFVHSIRRILGLHLLLIKGTQKFFSSSCVVCQPLTMLFCCSSVGGLGCPAVSPRHETRHGYSSWRRLLTERWTQQPQVCVTSSQVAWPFQTLKYQLSPY